MSFDETGKRPAVGVLTSEGEDATQRERYFFDPVRFDEEIQESLAIMARREDWESIRRKYDLLQMLRQWSEVYSGQVPKEWGEVAAGSPWHRIVEDLQDPEIVLTDMETEAAIAYPVWHVPRNLALNRRLTDDHLMLLSARPDISYAGNASDIPNAQRIRGVDKQVLYRAVNLNRMVHMVARSILFAS